MPMEWNPGMNMPLPPSEKEPEVKEEKSWQELQDELYSGNDNAEQYNLDRLATKKKLIRGPMKKKKAA